jgi:HEAT repeat protein
MPDRWSRGLSDTTRTLLGEFLAWSGTEARWRPEPDTALRLHAIGERVEPYAIPKLLGFALATDGGVRSAAQSVIGRLFDRLSPDQLPGLDEALRRAWSNLDRWSGQRPNIKELRKNSEDDRIFLGLVSSHSDGFIREEAVKALGAERSDRVIPFLLVRLVDWVEPVRRAAELALLDRLQPNYAQTFVECLGLLERLAAGSRFAPAFKTSLTNFLEKPECAEYVLGGTRSRKPAVRRACFPVAAGNRGLDLKTVFELALRDEDVLVRNWAFRNGSSAFAAIGLDWYDLASKDPYPPIRREGYWALAQKAAAPGEIFRFLFDPSAGIRCSCQALFRDRFGLEPVGSYRAALESPDNGQAEIAVRGLAETGTREDGDRLKALLSHPSARVRCAAVGASGSLRVEHIAPLLIGLVAADRRSVAREAASVLLAGKLADPRPIWTEARKNPHEGASLAVLRKMRFAGKWQRLGIYLESLECEDPALAECGLEQLRLWEIRYNRSFILPSSKEASDLLQILERVASRIPADLAHGLHQLLLACFVR